MSAQTVAPIATYFRVLFAYRAGAAVELVSDVLVFRLAVSDEASYRVTDFLAAADGRI